MSRLMHFLPFVLVLVFGAAAAAMFIFERDPHTLESVLINQEVPPFDLPALQGRDRGFGSEDLKGQVTLVNVFGSWCVACRVEHPFLEQLKRQNAIPIYGIDWKEENRTAGPAWLARYGDPYTLVGDDPDSKAAIAFGVTGAPETFVVDKKGIIRYKHTGPLLEDSWNETVLPLVQRLRAEP
ncbi:MAG: DsbE family thiol:disulfide interchange protein [Magnetovibrionaceae bacterium]